MRQRFQGTIKLDLVVLADGTVGDVRLIRSIDADSGLDRAAIDSARQWRFAPATDATGTPIPVLVDLELDFRLH